jgi:hypothetical protein
MDILIIYLPWCCTGPYQIGQFSKGYFVVFIIKRDQIMIGPYGLGRTHD